MKFAKKDKRTTIEKTIDEELLRLCRNVNSREELLTVMTLVDKWEKHYETKKAPISKDTLLIIGGNLLGIVLILGYEKVNVITSKALGFVLRGRV